jgi:hypothetical protein
MWRTATVQGNILTKVRTVIDMPKEDEKKEDSVKELRKEINDWVASYRREPRVSGRPSYGCAAPQCTHSCLLVHM